MTESPTILTRRGMFRAGAGLALAATATPLLAPVSAQADAQQAGASQSNLSAKEKEEVIRDIFKSFETKNQDVLKYVNSETFIQHNLNIEDGIQGLRTFYAKLPKDIKIKIIRIFVDGDYVVAQREISFPGKERVSIDVFRFEEGQVVEHWENVEDKCPPNFSGRTQIDGPTAVTDTDKTAANKKVFQNYMDIIIFGGQKDRVGEFRSLDNYHQHNCQAEDNKSGFQLTRGIFSKPGAVFKVERSHLILGEGNFVISLNEGMWDSKHSATFDLYRVENGKLVEHWDTIEAIPPRDQWKNSNGKF